MIAEPEVVDEDLAQRMAISRAFTLGLPRPMFDQERGGDDDLNTIVNYKELKTSCDEIGWVSKILACSHYYTGILYSLTTHVLKK